MTAIDRARAAFSVVLWKRWETKQGKGCCWETKQQQEEEGHLCRLSFVLN